MKKLTVIILLFCMFFALSACNNNNSTIDEDTYQEDLVTDGFAIPLGDTGAKVAIPAEMGFETFESKQNEFFGGGPNSEWAIIANTEAKSDYSDYSFTEYVSLTAQANEGTVKQDSNGNYYFTYIKEGSDAKVYKFYTAVREGVNKYYRIAFYCFDDKWDYYSGKFEEWAMTIEVE